MELTLSRDRERDLVVCHATPFRFLSRTRRRRLCPTRRLRLLHTELLSGLELRRTPDSRARDESPPARVPPELEHSRSVRATVPCTGRRARRDAPPHVPGVPRAIRAVRPRPRCARGRFEGRTAAREKRSRGPYVVRA